MRLLAIPLLGCLVLGTAAAQPDEAPMPRRSVPFPTLEGPDAWAKLPPRQNPPLPDWARVLSGPLPKTTAKMLELDTLHREKNPLGPVLSAKLRAAVAERLRSRYGAAVARADLERAGLTESEAFDAGRKPASAEERLALSFAVKLTEEGHAITDEEFLELLDCYGPAKATAIVHTVAYANFHNRILLALGVRGESPVVPPVAVKFDTDTWKTTAPARPPWDDVKSVSAEGPRVRVEWSNHELEDLKSTLEKQKNRKLRVPLPDRALFKNLAGREKQQAETIVWMTVSAGYQLEMTRAWFACLQAFYEEGSIDRVFGNSMFWVVTRTNDCFY
jgi:alkylhydroperoxidase family enzyme